MTKPTWRQYDKLETRQADAVSAVVDFVATLVEMDESFDDGLRKDVIEAGQKLADTMRRARFVAEVKVREARGHRP